MQLCIVPSRLAAVVKSTKWAAAEWGDDRLGCFFALYLQYCCSQCRSGRETPLDLEKEKKETLVAPLKTMISTFTVCKRTKGCEFHHTR